ncbi:hypothetical protein GCM10023186_28870 [Hymenobacter koreensis]|uniref:DUF1571 domain-containing protein n=1 Tax=Hymenobacter koreensis TaxID=1084523 RepID=A0ABP8J683_9BACT
MLGLLAGASIGFAQQASTTDSSAAELKKNIAIIKREDKNGEGSGLIEGTTKKLVTYLKRYDLSAAEAQTLGLHLSVDSKDANGFKVYTFVYDSGNSRGAISIPVMQWKNQAGKLFAFAPAIQSSFFKVRRLNSPGRTLYLLLGTEKGSAGCTRNQAQVVQLKGDYLLLDTPAFGKRASLDLCNVWMEFDARQQKLILEASPFSFDSDGPEDEQYQLLKRLGLLNPTAPKTGVLRFNGQRFVKP